MKVEPLLDLPSLIGHIQELYHFTVQDLSFIPEGECSVAYAVGNTENQRYFLKLWPDNRQGRMIQARLDTILPLSYELFFRKFIPNLPAPIPTHSGELYCSFNGYALALFPFIEGQPVKNHADIFSNGVGQQVAETMANLHKATHFLSAALPQKSPFEVAFRDEMRWGLAALEAVGTKHPPGQVRLRELLFPHRAKLLAELDRLDRLQQFAVQLAKSLVLCHTDMGGNNVLVNQGGKVYILDWDDLILAPPEQDVQEYRGAYFTDFLASYRMAGGISDLSPLQFAFYLLRRYLGDLTDWLIRILTENTDPKQDVFDLQGIEEYCLPRLAGFDNEIMDITRSIDLVTGRITRLASDPVFSDE